MLLSYQDLRQFAVEATDGRKGHVADFYFDDVDWRIGYLVTETGVLFTRSQALVKSTHVGRPDLAARSLPVSLSTAQLDAAEAPDSVPTVSDQRRRAIRLRQFEEWPPLMLGVPGAAYTPEIAERQLYGGAAVERDLEETPEPPGDPHLRSMAEVSGYVIAATDGEIGSLSDFLLDPDGWRIRYLAIDTGTWLRGRQVVVRPDRISGVSWAGQSVACDLTRDEIEGARALSQIDELERGDVHLAFTP